MSVGFTFRVDIRPFSGSSDPRLPIASWVAQGGAVGNASGGALNMDFPFQRDGDAQISELFNLEQMAVDTSTAVARGFTLTALNLDSLSQNRPLTDVIWFFQTVSDGLTLSALDMDQNILPLWLGTPNRFEGDSGLRLNTPNIDLLLYLVTLEGYMWGPRSVLADGGPQRPVSGMFGR